MGSFDDRGVGAGVRFSRGMKMAEAHGLEARATHGLGSPCHVSSAAMLIPLGTDRPLRRPTVVTYALIGLNVSVYLRLVSVAACTGGYLVLFPRAHVKVLVWFFYIGVVQIPAWAFIVASVAWEWFQAGLARDNIAHEAHAGGYAFGALISVGLLWLKVLPRE